MGFFMRNLSLATVFLKQIPSSLVAHPTLSRILNGQSARCCSSQIAQPAEDQREKDELYRRLEVEVRGHDPAVLKSYEWFTITTAKHLNITLSRTWVPKVQKIRRKALKSAFAHGKHIVKYEFRTYFRVFEFVRLTSSTADTFLEYIQRNLPEGVAMKVTKERIERLPPHVTPSMKADE